MLTRRNTTLSEWGCNAKLLILWPEDTYLLSRLRHRLLRRISHASNGVDMSYLS